MRLKMICSNMADVIYSYTLEEAVADGVLAEIFKDQWQELSRGKPIVATEHLFVSVNSADLVEIWNRYVYWRKKIMPTLPEERQMFATSINERKIWVIEDGQAFTLLYPEDY